MLTKFDDIKKPEPDTDDLEGWIVVEGKPTMKTQVLHTNKEKNMISGIWEATPGTYHATYSAYEFVHIITGKIKITPDDGSSPKIVGAGDTFIVESNFKGTWEIQESVLKHFDVML
jgi:uncharacterized protein